MAAPATRWVAAHPVATTFCVALALRAFVALLVTLLAGGSLFLDDESYSRMAQDAADGRLSDDPYLDWLYTRTGVLLWPITALYALLGPVELAGQLYVALLGAAAAALTTRLALEVTSWRWALAAGLTVALLPSQVLWSSLILKDAAVWAVLVGIGVTAAVANRSDGRRLAGLGVALAALVVLLGFLRLHTLEVAVFAIAIAACLGRREGRWPRLAGAALILVLVPLAFGMGAGGVTFVTQSRAPDEQRAANAAGASTAVVDVKPGAEPKDASAPADTGVSAPSGGGAADQITYLPTGLAVVALRPWPWETTGDGSTGVRMARVEALLWYPLLILALVGLVTVRGRMWALAFPLLAAAGTLVMYALSEGNLGTAYRHRGEVVWVVALMAALGAQRILKYRRTRDRYPARP